MPLSCSALARSWRETILSRRAFATAWLDSHDLLSGISMRRSWSAKASYWSNSCSKSDLNHLILSMSTTRSLESWESCPTDVTDDAGVDCESLNYHLWFIMWMQLIMQVRGSTVRHKNNSFWILESGLIAKLTTQMASPIDVWTLNREIAARILILIERFQNLCKVVHYTHSSIQYAELLCYALQSLHNFWVCQRGPRSINIF